MNIGRFGLIREMHQRLDFDTDLDRGIVLAVTLCATTDLQFNHRAAPWPDEEVPSAEEAEALQVLMTATGQAQNDAGFEVDLHGAFALE